MWQFEFLGVTKLDTQPMEEQPLREIAIERLKEKKERQRTQQLPEEHVQKLVKEEEKHSVRDMVKMVQELQEQNQELEEIRETKLKEITEEPREAVLDRIRQKTNELMKRAVEINKYKKDKTSNEFRQQAVKMNTTARMMVADEQDPRAEERDEWIKNQTQEFKDMANAVLEDKDAKRDEKRHAEELLEMSNALDEDLKSLEGQDQNSNIQQAQQMLADAPQPTEQMSPEQLAQMPPEDLYDRAKALEEKADQTFTDIKTAELSQQQNATLQEARQNLSHTPPQRPEMGKQLAEQKDTLKTREDLKTFRKQLQDTVKKVDEMKVATADKVSQAQGMTKLSKALGNQSPQQQYRARAMMNKFASGSQANVDMSSIMRQMAMGMATSTSAGMGDHRETEGGAGTYSDPDDIAPKNIKGINIPSSKVMAQALPGQKFSKDSARHGWLYLDTWYIIGPWENHGKLDHRDIFPPELSIDFDAEYLGKKQTRGPDKGQPMKLKWQFTQSGRIQVVPPNERSNAVYYAYTEVHFDQNTDMLLAVASDDSSKLWINDLVVWDDKTHSDWRIGEGSRKVFFKKGYNKLLLRLENRGSETEFSVLICPPTFK
ncbi:MAG: hypothetical protein CMJ19_11800 [Phycisphaeraceae bacterium]|nr:hypothetical protein [Phycisphaeraceae bacterium]